jgi:hypothetical protein
MPKRSALRVAIIDDRGKDEPFYHDLIAKIEGEQDLPLSIIWINDEVLFSGPFNPELVTESLRNAAPEVIFLDMVLRQAGGHHDYQVCNMLLQELRDDVHLKNVPLLLLSQYLEGHCFVTPDRWRRWSFSKNELQNEAGTWARFAEYVFNPKKLAAEQEGDADGPRICPRRK